MTLSSEQFHTLYDGAAQPVVLVQDGAVAECNCHAQEFFTAGTALCAYLPLYYKTNAPMPRYYAEAWQLYHQLRAGMRPMRYEKGSYTYYYMRG